MENDGLAHSISLIAWRTIVQNRPCLDGTPVLERQMGAFRMFRDRANVIKEAGQEVGLEERCEMWEVRLYHYIT